MTPNEIKQKSSLYLAVFEIMNGEEEYVIKHSLRANGYDDAERISLEFAKHFWERSDDAEPIDKESKFNRGWYSPYGRAAIKLVNLEPMSSAQIIKDMMINDLMLASRKAIK